MKFTLLIVLVLAGCSFKKNPLLNQIHKGHEELYAEPNAPKKFEAKDVKRIVIAATNDIEGNFDPQAVSFKDDFNKETLRTSIGGSDAASAYFSILRSEYKNVLLVDSGDIFSQKVSVKDVQRYYESNRYDALTVGLNDFNQKLPKGVLSSSTLFRDFAKGSDVPLVLSNLYELKTARGVEWKGTLPYLLKDVGGIKVGIIGLIPDDIVNLSPVDNRVGLYVEEMLKNTLRQARLLRSLGADLVVVLTHQGIPCGHELAQDSRLPLEKVNFEPDQKGVCELNNILGTYLERLPPHLVDVVIAGRTQEKIANYVNETLVLSSFGHGKSMIYAEFFLNIKEKKIIKARTVVHQPVMFCREFFKATNDCFTGDPSVNHLERIHAKFLGKEILLDNSDDHVSAIIPKKHIDLDRALNELNSDIAFNPNTSGNSQMILVKVTGSELIRMMEEDFNNGSAKNWYPSPYQHDNKTLTLKVKGESILASSQYVILSDLEGIQTHQILSKAIFKGNAKTKPTYSWTSFETVDEVKTQMAAQVR